MALNKTANLKMDKRISTQLKNYSITVGAKQPILRIVRIGNVSFSELDHEALVENGVGNLIGAHFGLRLGLSIQTGVHDREEPVFEEWQLVTANLVAIACHLGLAVAAHLELGVPITPAVPF